MQSRARRHPILKPPSLVPHFESRLITEPLLSFGGQHMHVDPKTGLSLYGLYSLIGQTAPTLKAAIIGIVGPASMVADAEAWLVACKGMLTNDGSQPFLYPHFPGFNDQAPFQCEFVYGDTWRETIRDIDIKAAIASPDFFVRVKQVVRLFTDALETIAAREPQPQVVLCCIPQDIVDTCTVQKGKRARPKKVPATHVDRAGDKRQLDLFAGPESSAGTEDEETGHQNLRRGLKAEAMHFGLPTQLVWPRTLKLAGPAASGPQRTQDIATRAWNFCTALYHKAGGSPWRLAEMEPGVCFVGVSFYRELLEENPRIRSSMAQAFTAAGDGYVLRGKAFEWNEREHGRSPHLDKNLAASLLRDVIELYQKQNRGSLPARVVVHKTSRFWPEEIEGLEEACHSIPRRDFVALGSRRLQFYRTGDYPALRGTYVKFSESDLLLYTSGYVPYLRTYPGARVPQPLEILEHIGDSPWDTVLREILCLTKMNWNTADFAGRDPITTAFSRRVGQVLAEIPAGRKIRPEYRFYM
jgi:hypothetical protein